MSWNVQGKVGVITGASCALGKEVARRLSEQHGMKVACVSRREFTATLPHGCVPFLTNISGGGECDALMRDIKAQMGSISLLVNCAGATLSKMHVRCTDEDYDVLMNTNLRAALNLTKAALRHGGLLQTQDGSVLHIGSVAGVVGNEGQVLYAASKAALSGATKSWAKEYGSRNLRFNVVAPGLMQGEGMGTTLSAAQLQHWRDACALKRLGTVPEVADMALAVALCPYMNGQTICVDGGVS